MYYALDRDTALDYVRQSPVITEILGDQEDLRCVDLAEGNVNLIYRIYSDSHGGRSVLLKQALPHSRRYPDFKMPLERARIEYDLLQIEANYCPDLVPKVYLYDAEMYLNVMEDLNRHIVMRYGLMKQVRYPRFASDIGTFLARTLFYTSDLHLLSVDKKAMVPRFINPVLSKVTEDLVFTQPYTFHANNRYTRLLDPQVLEIYRDDELRSEVFALKESFMANAQALVHGDLHTGSIMVNERETKVIDPEFAFFGPMGFDIGAVLGNLALSYASQEYHARDRGIRVAYQQWLVDTIHQLWNTFETEFRRLWETDGNDYWPSPRFRDRYLAGLLQDAAGFGACKMMRRILGLAHVPDLDSIPDDRDRAVCESLALNAARAWLMNRHTITSIKDLTDMLTAAKPRSPMG